MERIGWIGTGVMGKSMCVHLMKNGYPLSVYNRTRKSTENLCREGAVWLDSPGAVAAKSDIVFTMVGEPKDVEEVILGRGGALENLRPGAVIVDMTTSEPSLARRIYPEFPERCNDETVQRFNNMEISGISLA